jgi:hypothetical protein
MLEDEKTIPVGYRNRKKIFFSPAACASRAACRWAASIPLVFRMEARVRASVLIGTISNHGGNQKIEKKKGNTG